MSATEASPEQFCYIPCSFCNIVLAVSVPCSSLSDIVTVRCGNCAKLCFVNMSMAALSNSTSQDSSLQYNQQDVNYTPSHSTVDLSSSSRYIPIKPPSPLIVTDQKTINHPPEKRTRVPSAYNQFIKQEIQRIKANDPNITHKEAFSAASKNWAHFPHIHFGVSTDANSHQEELNEMKYVQGSMKRLKSTAESFSI